MPRNRSLDGEVSVSRALDDHHHQDNWFRVEISQTWRVRSVELRQFCRTVALVAKGSGKEVSVLR